MAPSAMAPRRAVRCGGELSAGVRNAAPTAPRAWPVVRFRVLCRSAVTGRSADIGARFLSVGIFIEVVRSDRSWVLSVGGFISVGLAGVADFTSIGGLHIGPAHRRGPHRSAFISVGARPGRGTRRSAFRSSGVHSGCRSPRRGFISVAVGDTGQSGRSALRLPTVTGPATAPEPARSAGVADCADTAGPHSGDGPVGLRIEARRQWLVPASNRRWAPTVPDARARTAQRPPSIRRSGAGSIAAPARGGRPTGCPGASPRQRPPARRSPSSQPD